MIYPASSANQDQGKNPESCLRQKLGSCRGCNIALIGIGLVRWEGLTIEEAEDKIHKEHCQNGEYPDLTVEINHDACFAMGADHRGENLEGLTRIPRLGWQSRR